MREIELINTSQILKELDIEIKSYISEKGSSDRSEYWSDILRQLSLNYKEYISWSNINAFEEITQLEALFLLLNLPTRFLIKNKEFEVELNDYLDSTLDRLIKNSFINSVECIALSRNTKIRIANDWGERNAAANINTPLFLTWSKNNNFIKYASEKKESPVAKSESTLKKKKLIQTVKQEILSKHPATPNTNIANEIAEIALKDIRFEEFKKKGLSAGNILRNYL